MTTDSWVDAKQTLVKLYIGEKLFSASFSLFFKGPSNTQSHFPSVHSPSQAVLTPHKAPPRPCPPVLLSVLPSSIPGPSHGPWDTWNAIFMFSKSGTQPRNSVRASAFSLSFWGWMKVLQAESEFSDGPRHVDDAGPHFIWRLAWEVLQ